MSNSNSLIKYYYSIFKNVWISCDDAPIDKYRIAKIERSKWPHGMKYSGKNAEGPFKSIKDLKQKSKMLTEVSAPKERNQLLNPCNFELHDDLIFTLRTSSFNIDFIRLITHTLIGSIRRKKVKGVHFYDPENVRIIEKLFEDKASGCFQAIIEMKHQETGSWVKSDNSKSFFPDYWSINRLFHEIYIAYQRRRTINQNKSIGLGSSGVKIVFYFNEDGKLKTCYPLVNSDE